VFHKLCRIVRSHSTVFESAQNWSTTVGGSQLYRVGPETPILLCPYLVVVKRYTTRLPRACVLLGGTISLELTSGTLKVAALVRRLFRCFGAWRALNTFRLNGLHASTFCFYYTYCRRKVTSTDRCRERSAHLRMVAWCYRNRKVVAK